MSEADDDGSASTMQSGDEDQASPAAIGFRLLVYVPTTVVGFAIFLAGVSDFHRYLTAGFQQFDGFATSLFLLTVGVGILLPSLAAASVRTRRMA